MLGQCPWIGEKEMRSSALEKRSVLAKSDGHFLHSDRRTGKARGYTVEGGCTNATVGSMSVFS